MGLPQDKLAFLEWIVSPIENRIYATQKELAAYLGVAEQTLVRWKKSKEIREAIAVASMDWGEQQLPKVVNALFTYAQAPGGDKDRMTIIRYFMPAVLMARANKQFEVLEQATDASKQVSKELAMSYLSDCTVEEQDKFLRIFHALGSIAGQEQAEEPEPYRVTREDEDILDLVSIAQAPTKGKGGRPRGSRSVSLRVVQPEPAPEDSSEEEEDEDND